MEENKEIIESYIKGIVQNQHGESKRYEFSELSRSALLELRGNVSQAMFNDCVLVQILTYNKISLHKLIDDQLLLHDNHINTILYSMHNSTIETFKYVCDNMLKDDDKYIKLYISIVRHCYSRFSCDYAAHRSRQAYDTFIEYLLSKVTQNEMEDNIITVAPTFMYVCNFVRKTQSVQSIVYLVPILGTNLLCETIFRFIEEKQSESAKMLIIALLNDKSKFYVDIQKLLYQMSCEQLSYQLFRYDMLLCLYECCSTTCLDNRLCMEEVAFLLDHGHTLHSQWVNALMIKRKKFSLMMTKYINRQFRKVCAHYDHHIAGIICSYISYSDVVDHKECPTLIKK